jgi:hypothetical protein
MTPTENTLATRPNATAAAIPAQYISDQWERAQEGLVEIIRFGALMVQLGRALGDGRRRNQHSGQTLKGWLAQHCPEINYHTAIGYRDAALGVARAAALPDEMPLLSLMEGEGAFDADHAQVHERVMQVIGTSSIALLKAESRRGGHREGAGRPPKTLGDTCAELEEALRCARRLSDDLSRWAIVEDQLGELPDGPLDAFVAEVAHVAARGREILAGRKSSGKIREA